MKMIAATRFNKAQRAMEAGRFFGMTSSSILSHLGFSYPPGSNALDISTSSEDWSKRALPPDPSQPVVLIVCSSDRGLCGAIHSSVSRAARTLIRESSKQSGQKSAASESALKVVILGDKAKGQVARQAKSSIIANIGHIGRKVPTFSDSIAAWGAICRASSLTHSDSNAAIPLIIYNKFASAIAFDTVITRSPLVSEISASPGFAKFDSCPEIEETVNKDLAEYLAVSRLFMALVEGHAAELSSKRSAMENATKNSDQMADSLTKRYNRTRQAVITNELVDIIVGASAL